MKTFDSETEDFGATTIEAAPARRPKASGQAAAPKRKPVRDSSGPSNRKVKQRQRPAGTNYNIISFFRDYRTHLAFGIFLCLTAIVMAVCGVSYIFSAEADQSVTHGREVSEIVASGDTLDNAGGAVGAKLAELLLVNGFGVGSFILAFYVFVLGLACMRACRISFFSFSFKCLFSAAALSMIVGLLSYNQAAVYFAGGEHGHYMNTLLLQYSGALGAYAVMVLLVGLLVAIFLNPLRTFFTFMAKMMAHKPKPVDAGEAADEVPATDDAAADAMAALDTDSAEALDLPVGDADPEDAGGIPADHARFMPAAGLDVFAEDMPEGENEGPEDEAELFVRQTLTDNSDQPSDPEFVVVTKQDMPDGSGKEIRHGDHITIDTPYDVNAIHSAYEMPSPELLEVRPHTNVVSEAELLANKRQIVDAFSSFNIEIQRIEATIGPTVTLYEIVPAQGVRISKIKSLEDDIAMYLSALSIRIIAPLPGKGAVGIEVPNRKPQVVSMREIIESAKFRSNNMMLPMAMGSTISNDVYIKDLAKCPHLLVAGATGQGKSVGLNCIIASLLYSRRPDELKFVLVDPKTVEFSLFECISKQYLAKLPDEEKAVITDPKKVVDTLNSLCVEMEERYKMLSNAHVKKLEEYNDKFRRRQLNPNDGFKYLPYIVVIVDEYADLVMVAGKDVALPICRIAQKARAVGIHMIIATQRPSTDIITGKIKANFTARIAFKVTQGVDSKTILDRPGAQRLIGRGDMLTMMNGDIERVQCAFVDTPEIEAICEHISNQPGFTGCYLLPDPPAEDGSESGGSAEVGAVTEEFKRCALYVASQTQMSTSLLQRKFEIGFNKASRFMDQMQTMGIVGPQNGVKPREVHMTPDEVERLFE